MAYVYIRSEPALWTVGFYRPDGKFEPESDHDNPGDAGVRVSQLNGGSAPATPPLLTSLDSEDWNGDPVITINHDVDRQVEAVLDLLAPWADLPPAAWEAPAGRIRVPLILVDFQGHAVRPSDEQLRAMAEQIVTAIRTATGGAS